ncbi:polysaccharide biosynthesis tyrosine autokinase [Psychrobacter urativorans]|uniref:Lipopolysaccharide biosynthesis protein n=1 Tax=Psychrobacter urativorans TaxID=45610 RepID=A0A0M4TDZ4_9GAMM|nr:polysaccharide biosynthesis tyrosine autokinase [Psychrobacter urativorans]ALF59166.1 lipopolysaccharide biosynthesis protein [Psychrobacter urativorans]
MNTESNKFSKPIAENDNDEIDLLALLLGLLRGWKTLLLFAFLGLVIGVLYSRYLNPVFKSDALIQIDNKFQGVSALGSNISDLVSPDVSPAQTEAELIKSRMILKPVVDLLHLDIRLNDPTINKLDRIKNNRTDTQVNSPESVILDTEDGPVQIRQFNVSQAYLNQSFTLVKSKTGFILSNGFDDFKGQLNQLNRFIGSDGIIQITVTDLPNDNHPITITKQSLQNTTDAINGALIVKELGNKTGIIQLSLTGSNQQQVSLILNQIILSYVGQNQSRGSEETTKTLTFMETQIPALKQKLEASEKVFNEFREKYGTIDIGQEAGLLLSENSKIDSQINDLKLKKADLITYYTEDHPLVIQINEQLKVLNNKKQEIDDRVTRLPNIQREFLKLSEDTGINREIYLTMLKNYEQLKIVKAGQIGYARIIDSPISTYRAIAPNKKLIILLATILGTFLGATLVLLKNLLKSTVKDSERLETKTGVPVIATIPSSPLLSRLSKNKKAPNRLLAYVDSNSLSYEAIKSLRTHLMFGMPKEGKAGQRAKVILISGESPGVGKSFISANLAEVFGQLNTKVLVIDADMRLGELHKIFNMDQDNGLADYLSQKNDELQVDDNLADFIHSTSMDHIDFMPRGKHPHNPVSLLAGDSFRGLMTQLNAYYDYIVIDSPPILAASDAIILSQYADKVLMVTRYEKSIEGQLVYAIKQLNKANVRVDGIILNDVKQGLMSKYSYNYSYAYGSNK